MSIVTADNFVDSIIEDTVGAFSDDLSDEVSMLVELLCPPVGEFEDDGCDSDEECADFEERSGVEEEEAKRGELSAMHTVCHASRAGTDSRVHGHTISARVRSSDGQTRGSRGAFSS